MCSVIWARRGWVAGNCAAVQRWLSGAYGTYRYRTRCIENGSRACVALRHGHGALPYKSTILGHVGTSQVRPCIADAVQGVRSKHSTSDTAAAGCGPQAGKLAWLARAARLRTRLTMHVRSHVRCCMQERFNGQDVSALQTAVACSHAL